ncbi:hypothetical protein ACLMAJ_25315 [Nocardia sp. KC 131]|uniref:hypothetical protein n=1 Tax=Nocardia arseniciresistens TaxID=3392119 RepID=UPI00398F7A8F
MKRKLLRAIRRLLGRKESAGNGGGRGPDGGGAAGVREPLQPPPPDDHLSATRPFDPDPKTLTFRDPRQ